MNIQVQNDNELIKMVQSGDKAKLGILYERHKKDLFYYFFRMTNDQNKSEDMVQNTFLKVMKYHDQFTGKGEFSYWLFSIARNLWIDTLKKKDALKNSYSESALFAHPDYTHNSEQRLIKDEQIKLLEKALNNLNSDKKEAIVLARYKGMKYHEIASLTGTTENNVKSRIRRGLQELKSIMQHFEAR